MKKTPKALWNSMSLIGFSLLASVAACAGPEVSDPAQDESGQEIRYNGCCIVCNDGSTFISSSIGTCLGSGTTPGWMDFNTSPPTYPVCKSHGGPNGADTDGTACPPYTRTS
jgi:hypothetical protein